MKYLSAYSIFLILILSCESTNEPSSNSEDYFPLKIGNKWYYSSYPDTNLINIIWEVIAEKEIDEKRYYQIIKQNLQSNSSYSTYYRFSGDTLYYRSEEYREQILADFSLSLNDTTYWREDLTVTEKTDTYIKFETPFYADYGFSITFKKGIGITRLIENGYIYYNTKLINSELN